MARGASIKLYSKGIEEIAKGRDMRNVIEDVAETVAANVRDQGIKVGGPKGDTGEIDLPVEVTSSVTDRARSVVRITHPAGLAVQAKYGALTRAAAQAGLQVKADD